ncbi:hypothetical protein QR680_000033 [Steinernema hermaphroditum]|uniref:GHMP kinase N-terminal domain-containing protein n=1 Tax=Steinernema hermaphroditum TaxID=289476 RepID=A0AA39GT29_9BILA|nr:hypothetical protein QR680_000033 [Steinernema hermaphroditum]
MDRLSNDLPANGFDNFTERPAWRKQLRHVEQLLHRSGLDTVSLAKEINDEYEKCANRERPQFLDALFHIAVHTEEHNMFMCRFAVLLMEFLKNRFGSLEVQSQPFTLKPLSANAKHELSYLCTELIRAESRAVEGSNTQEELRISLTNVMHGLFKLLKQYVRVGVERFSSQREFIKMRALSNGARYASVTTRMSARIDLAGGWTDTPPITFGHANGVVNMAIKVGGEKPVKCTVTKVFHSEKEALILTSVQTEREKLTIESIPGLKMFSADPDRFGSLILSSIQATGLITTGMTTLRQLFDALFPHEHVMEVHVATSSLLPQGSGLGTSSILSACFLCSLAKIMNKEIDRQTIAATVLQAEQILTTGGGWQDQVGALYPGIKYSSYENGSLNVDVLHITDQLQQEIEQRLVLVYTGKTRLAANVLHKVVYKFVVGRSEFIQHIVDIANTATLVRNALLSNKFPVKESSRYNALKSTMAENAFPPDVKCLIEDLQSRNIIEAGWMCGAGGGGFACVWLSITPGARKLLDSAVHLWNNEAHTYSVQIDEEPMEFFLTAATL